MSETQMPDYDPCDHGRASDCCACEINTYKRQALEDEEEIVLLQDLLARLVRLGLGEVPEAVTYLAARGLM